MTPPPLQAEAAPGLLIEVRSSVVEASGRWLALVLAITTCVTLLWVGFPWSRPSLDAATIERDFAYWGEIFVGTAIVTGVLAIAPPWLPRRRGRRWLLLAVIAIGATTLASVVQEHWYAFAFGDEAPPPLLVMQRHTLVVLATLLTILAECRRIHRDAETAIHQAEMNRVRLQSGLAAMRLQVLQAQIEPHFIFNSLANVRRLLRTDGPAGRAMLSDVLRYLESALPQLRDDAPTLGRELQLARAYLAVHEVRMGPRLRVAFDVEPHLLDRPVPPMMLLTLVENALKHGLGPLVEGGTISIGAHDDAEGRLTITVADTGCGLKSSIGHGTGLANIRARLKSMHENRARLTLAVNEPGGVVAAITLPAAT